MKAITVKYLGPNDTKGARLRASDGDGNCATVGYPYALSGEAVYRAGADALCAKMRWGGRLIGGEQNAVTWVFVFDAEVTA